MRNSFKASDLRADGGLRDAESMLDQLVAFCGNKITEPDVLNVFGFTGEQTVTNFTGKILRGETADALEMLHSEAENGAFSRNGSNKTSLKGASS